MQKRMQHQGGWAATFVVVGIVLLAGLIGGVYYLKTRTTDQQVATNDGATSEIERALEKAGSDKKDATNEQSEQNNKSENKDDNSTPVTETPPTQDTTKLPETGPADVFAKFLAVTALTVASVAYLRSR
jgi:type II secretory pathway pseudopilin PulG